MWFLCGWGIMWTGEGKVCTVHSQQVKRYVLKKHHNDKMTSFIDKAHVQVLTSLLRSQTGKDRQEHGASGFFTETKKKEPTNELCLINNWINKNNLIRQLTWLASSTIWPDALSILSIIKQIGPLSNSKWHKWLLFFFKCIVKHSLILVSWKQFTVTATWTIANKQQTMCLDSSQYLVVFDPTAVPSPRSTWWRKRRLGRCLQWSVWRRSRKSTSIWKMRSMC